MLDYSADLKNKHIEIDAGIKLSLAILLAIASSFCNNGLELIYLSIYLLVVTIFLKSDLGFVLKNLLSYGLVILFPYFLGLLLSLLISKLYSASFYNVSLGAAILKMIKLFFIWYIGNLYFFTTSFEPIVNMLSKVFSPLDLLGIPVTKYLNMVMVIVNELNRSVSQFKQDILEQARYIYKNKELGFKTKAEGLSDILAAFIANSLQRTDEIQEQVELSRVNACQYTLRISKNEIVAICSSTIFIFSLLRMINS